MGKLVLPLTHSFDPGLSGKGAKVITVKPYEVTIHIVYDAGKDADNEILHKDLTRLWNAFCKMRGVMFKKEVETTVAILFAQILKLKANGKLQTDAAFTQKALEAVIDARNTVMSNEFDKWQKGYIKEVNDVFATWSSTNTGAKMVSAKRVGSVVSSIASITYALVNPLDLKGKIMLVKKMKGLYDNVRSLCDNIGKKASNVIKEIDNLIKVAALVESESKAGKFIKWLGKVDSLSADLTKAMSDYEDDIKLLTSTEKKLAALLRDIKAKAGDDGTSADVIKATKDLSDAHDSLVGHIGILRSATRKFNDLNISKSLVSMQDKAKAGVMKKATASLNALKKKFQGDLAALKKVQVVDSEIATLENGLKANNRGATITL